MQNFDFNKWFLEVLCKVEEGSDFQEFEDIHSGRRSGNKTSPITQASVCIPESRGQSQDLAGMGLSASIGVSEW
jgi:hypothetical protein